MNQDASKFDAVRSIEQEAMELKINTVDHRSPHTGLSSTSFYILVSVSTVSIGGSLLLATSPAHSYTATDDVATAAIEDNSQSTTDNLTASTTDSLHLPSETLTYESELSRLVTPDSLSDFATVDSGELIPETVPATSEEIDSSTLSYESIDLQELDNEPIYLTSSSIDLVQEFDAIVAQSQEPFIEIPDYSKNVQVETIALEPALEESTPEASQSEESIEPDIESSASRQANDLGEPLVTVQGVYLLEGDDSSARARLSASYALTPNVLFGATLDLTTGDAFTDSPETGFDLNELYVTVSPPSVPSLRLTLGMIDLTSYFDRNSFAKDAATHFFNPVFQTNPALAAAGIGSRPGALVNWDVTDNLSIRGAAFSSDRDLEDFAFDAAAAEVALRLGNFIVRGTYVTDRDAGQESGFNEIFQFRRDGDEFGLESDDREVAYGMNAEYFIPEINLGLFARYGWYENQALDRGGNTYSFGLNVLDLFFADDRLGLGYGRELSNESLRREDDEDIPDVLELFYDVRLTRNFRVGVSLQERDGFSETVAGLRVRADFNLSELWR